MLRTLLAFMAAVMMLASPAGLPAQEQRTRISISGSDTMNLLSQRLAEEFKKVSPTVEISVRGGGSGTGIADLLNGLVDIAQSSRKIKDGELAKAKDSGYDFKEHIVALDGLAVAVHKDNPVDELSLSQIKAIYTGAVTNWNQLNPAFPNERIVLFSREANCGTYDFFKEHVMGGSDFAANTSYMAATAAVANSVASNKNAIGFGGVAYFVRAENVKALKVKKDRETPGVSPILADKREVNLAAIQDGSYPISRPLYFYTPGEPAGAVKSFLDWSKGPAGQAIVLKEEYIPLVTVQE